MTKIYPELLGVMLAPAVIGAIGYAIGRILGKWWWLLAFPSSALFVYGIWAASLYQICSKNLASSQQTGRDCFAQNSLTRYQVGIVLMYLGFSLLFVGLPTALVGWHERKNRMHTDKKAAK